MANGSMLQSRCLAFSHSPRVYRSINISYPLPSLFVALPRRHDRSESMDQFPEAGRTGGRKGPSGARRRTTLAPHR